MNTSKKTAIVVGILFIIATVSSSLGFFLRDPILEAPDYLVQVAAKETQVLIGVFLVLVDCVAVVLIPAMLYLILKKHDRAWALGYLAFRTIESVIIIVGEICLLALLTLSHRFVEAGAPDASYYETLGALLVVAYRQGTHLIGLIVAQRIRAFPVRQELGFDIVSTKTVFANADAALEEKL